MAIDSANCCCSQCYCRNIAPNEQRGDIYHLYLPPVTIDLIIKSMVGKQHSTQYKQKEKYIRYCSCQMLKWAWRPYVKQGFPALHDQIMETRDESWMQEATSQSSRGKKVAPSFGIKNKQVISHILCKISFVKFDRSIRWFKYFKHGVNTRLVVAAVVTHFNHWWVMMLNPGLYSGCSCSKPVGEQF